MGQAIEGAIGTDLKIDATYMSKDVEMATTFESLTKQYGCSILFSGEFCQILSKDMRSMYNIRCVDQIMNQVGKKYELYTFDLSDELYNLPTTNEIGQLHMGGDTSSRDFYNMQIHKRFVKMSMLREINGQSQHPFFRMFEEDLELSLVSAFHPDNINHSLIKERYTMFKEAFNLYILSQWKEAEDLLQGILQDFPQDGPTKCILKFIREKQDSLTKRPPEDWMGYRKLE